MITEKLYDGITGIRDDIVERAENYVFIKKKRRYRGIVTLGTMAACACLLVMITLPHMAGGGSSSEGAYVTEGTMQEELADRVEAPAQAAEDMETMEEAGLEAAPEEHTAVVDYTCMLPTEILDGYEPEGSAAIYEEVVLQVKYYNEELQDELLIRIAHKEWFAEEMENAEMNKVLYRERLGGKGSYIYIDGGAYIAEYSFSNRDIAEMERFYDMVYSASFFGE